MMAKFLAGIGSITGHVVDGVTYTATSPNSPTAHTSNNNRRRSTGTGSQAQMGKSRGAGTPGARPSSRFTNLDNLITSLDASFDALTDPSPWVAYAAAITGNWQLCANCQPDYGAKKLFRQYNFNRALAGAATVAVPVDATAFCLTTGMSVYYQAAFTGFAPTSTVSWGSGVDGNIVTAVLGQALENPRLLLNPLDNGFPETSGPAFTWAKAIANTLYPAGLPSGLTETYVPLCSSDSNGAPGLRENIEVIILAP